MASAKQPKGKRITVVVLHREGSKRKRAHDLIVKRGALCMKEPRKVIEEIRKKLRVKPSTATSWFYDMRGKRSKAMERAAQQ